jgi:hypothetical protein
MCSGCRGSNSSADAPSSCCSSPTVVEVPERCSPPTKTKRCGRHGVLPTSHSSAQAVPAQPPPRATGAVRGVDLDAASAWTTTDALRVRSARACTPRCGDPALTACSASSRGCSSSRPTTAANTSASASARRTSTVVNIRVAGLRVPARLGLALLAALERGADGETSGLRLVERIRCPSQHGAAICTHFEPSAPKFVSLSYLSLLSLSTWMCRFFSAPLQVEFNPFFGACLRFGACF